MNNRSPEADTQLEAGLRRIETALAQNQNGLGPLIERAFGANGAPIAHRAIAKMSRRSARLAIKQELWVAREARRAERRAARRARHQQEMARGP